MLTKVKAATMAGPCSDAELDWSYNTWAKQGVKELVRTIQSNGYEACDQDVEQAGNMNEDGHDKGWYFLVPEAEVREQLRDINGRVNRGDDNPQHSFWLDRPDANEGDERSESSGGWGNNDCICGQGPCECRNIPTDVPRD